LHIPEHVIGAVDEVVVLAGVVVVAACVLGLAVVVVGEA
jgi:hypothetical protein